MWVLRQKVTAYIANGSGLVVLIDPGTRTVEVYRPAAEPEVFLGAHSVRLDPELPGLTLDLTPVFSEGN